MAVFKIVEVIQFDLNKSSTYVKLRTRSLYQFLKYCLYDKRYCGKIFIQKTPKYLLGVCYDGGYSSAGGGRVISVLAGCR